MDPDAHSSAQTRPRAWIAALLLFSLLALGSWLRIRHLGDLGLIVDEGNQILAVRGMLETGVPRVDSGLVYLRNLSFLGIQTLTAALWGLDEFSLRLPSALFGVAGIFAAYALALKIFDRRVAFATAALMTFSVWEIELSRYGRFYTAFQCMFLVSLLYFYRGFMLGEGRYRIYFWIATLLTFSVHELGVLLATCFLIPLPSTAFSRGQKLRFACRAVVLVGAWTLYRRLNTALETALMPDHALQLAGPELGAISKIRISYGLPQLPLPDTGMLVELAREQPWLLAAAAIIPAALTVHLGVRFLRQRGAWPTAFALATIWAAFMHQFTLALIAWAAYIAFFSKDLRAIGEPMLRAVYVGVAWCLIFWLGFLSAHTALPAKELIRVTFGYPNLLQYFLYWFVEGWPLFTAVLGVGSALLFARFISDRAAPMPLFILGALFLPMFVASVFETYIESRYVFHLYPLMIMISAWLLVLVGSRAWRALIHAGGARRALAAVGLGIAALVIGEDANPIEAWSVGNRTYRSPQDPVRSVISWRPYAVFHQDQKTPSAHVLERLAPDDRVIAMGPPHTIGVYHFYLDRVDYAVGRSEDHSYYRRIGGKRVGWVTGSKILMGAAALEKILLGAPGATWILTDRLLLEEDNLYYPEKLKEYVRSLIREPDYVGLDGQTLAVKIICAARPNRGASSAEAGRTACEFR